MDSLSLWERAGVRVDGRARDEEREERVDGGASGAGLTASWLSQ
jgi:hypothetical protein